MDRAWPRPTLRALDALNFDFGGEPIPLAEISHPLLVFMRDVWSPGSLRQRIASIDDRVLWKIKPNEPFRGAAWDDEDGTWLVAAGPRRDGDAEDFYRVLKEDCVRKRRDLNRAGHVSTKKTCSDHLLPDESDWDRLKLDRQLFAVRDARANIGQMVDSASKQPGTVHSCEAFGAEIECLVRRNSLDELYVAISVRSSAPQTVHDIVLSIAVPEAVGEDWEPMTCVEIPELSAADVVYMTLLEVPRLYK